MATPAPEGEIPRFFLYGDPVADVERDFLHVERIPERSGRHDWTIGAHMHPDHVQILLVERGGGTLHAEAEPLDIPPGALVVVPAGLVHGFLFRPGTDGMVITAALPFLAQVIDGDPDLTQALAVPGVHPVAAAGDESMTAIAFRALAREYVWAAPGRVAAIRGLMLGILVAVMRRQRAQRPGTPAPAPDRDHALVSRYRAELEQHFRQHRAMGFYAGRLGVSAARLNQACRARAGRTASDLLHDRLVIEAKRHLVFMARSVAEVGYDLGFEDPAYFSRFFARRVGMAPGAYRRAKAGRTQETAAFVHSPPRGIPGRMAPHKGDPDDDDPDDDLRTAQL